ncbi:MAG: ribosome maturation factor RimM [Terriglobales bacterium]
MSEYITIARIVKVQGRVGEVAAEILTDFPDRFADRRRLFLEQSGTRRELQLENFWSHKGWLILKFSGIESINDAEPLVGCEIQIPLEERAPLEEGATYVSDLVGCRVFVEGAGEIGSVTDVLSGTGEAPLLEVREGKKEYLIPFAQEYIRRVDVGEKRIELRLPEGMLELDAPLSADEKKIQHNEGE